VDEAVAALGMARASLEDQGLQAIVLDLQRACSSPRRRLPPIHEHATGSFPYVEGDGGDDGRARANDRPLLVEHPLRPAFVVPGATPASAALDLARTFLRRAERRLVAAREGGMTVSATLIAFVNRASDLVYVLRGGPPAMATSRLSHE